MSSELSMTVMEGWMRAALAEADRAAGMTYPNPAVGAVIVQGGEVVARGHTAPAGGPHAEIQALEAFREGGGSVDRETVLVVTLEPCSTQGRTGACTDAILASGIRRVVAGATDPYPEHRGRGFELLREAGVEVEAGVLAADCEDRNLIFHWFHRAETPLFAGKVATTLDGRIATRGGLSKWITGPEARADVHRWRAVFPAIAVGAGTVLADDPSLTARLPEQGEHCPQRYIFDRHLVTFRDRLPNVYSDRWKERTTVVTAESRAAEAERLNGETGIQFLILPEIGTELSFAGLEEHFRQNNLQGLYVEGGAHLLSSFIHARRLHYLFAYRSPKILADASGLCPFMGEEPVSMADTLSLGPVRHAQFGDDQLMRGYVRYPEQGETDGETFLSGEGV